jgi:hypothetical protein
MSNITHSASAPHAASVHVGSWVVPASACARTDRAATAMWTKQLPIASVAAKAVTANRNKGAAGAPGLWDPV